MGANTGANKSSPLSMTTTGQTSSVITVVVSGDVDLVTSPQLRDKVGECLEAGPRAMVIDMTGVNFCDSSGLTVLVALSRICTASSIDFEVVPSRVVRRVLELTGLTGTVNVSG